MLELLTTKKAEVGMWKENQKKEGSECHLNSDQDMVSHQNFWPSPCPSPRPHPNSQLQQCPDSSPQLLAHIQTQTHLPSCLQIRLPPPCPRQASLGYCALWPRTWHNMVGAFFTFFLFYFYFLLLCNYSSPHFPSITLPCPTHPQSCTPTAIQNLECHFLKKQPESVRSLPFLAKKKPQKG